MIERSPNLRAALLAVPGRKEVQQRDEDTFNQQWKVKIHRDILYVLATHIFFWESSPRKLGKMQPPFLRNAHFFSLGLKPPTSLQKKRFNWG